MPLVIVEFVGISAWPYLRLQEIGMGLSTLLLAWNLRGLRDQDLRLTGRWAALDTLRDPILVLDESDFIIDLNPAALNSMGVTRQDLLRRKLADLWPDLANEIARRQGIYHDQALHFTWERNPEQPLIVEINPLYDRRDRVLSKLIQLKPSNESVSIEAELQRLALELRNDQYISEALLSLEPLPAVINRVAGSLLSNYHLRLVWIARYIPAQHRLDLLAFRNDLSPEAERQLWIILGQSPPNKITPHQLPRLECRQESCPTCKTLFDQAQMMRGSLRELLEPWVTSTELENFAEATGIGACLHAPIKVGSELLGTIFVAGQGDVCLQPQMKASLRRVATQVAVVLENYRLQEDERHRSDELTHSRNMIATLSQVAARLEAAVEPEQIMHTLAEELRQLEMHCMITTYDAKAESLRLQYISEKPGVLTAVERITGKKFSEYRPPADLPSLDLPLKQRQLLFIRDILDFAVPYFPAIPPVGLRKVLTLIGIKPGDSIISLPLIVDGEVYGLLTMWGGGIEESDIPALGVFGKQVSLALQNSHLYQQVRERADELARSHNLLATLSKAAVRMDYMTGNEASSERTFRSDCNLSFLAVRLQELPADGVQFRADSAELEAAESDFLKERGALAALRVPLCLHAADRPRSSFGRAGIAEFLHPKKKNYAAPSFARQKSRSKKPNCSVKRNNQNRIIAACLKTHTMRFCCFHRMMRASLK